MAQRCHGLAATLCRACLCVFVAVCGIQCHRGNITQLWLQANRLEAKRLSACFAITLQCTAGTYQCDEVLGHDTWQIWSYVHTGEQRRMSSKCLTLAASIHSPTLVSSLASSRRRPKAAPITHLHRAGKGKEAGTSGKPPLGQDALRTRSSVN